MNATTNVTVSVPKQNVTINKGDDVLLSFTQDELKAILKEAKIEGSTEPDFEAETRKVEQRLRYQQRVNALNAEAGRTGTVARMFTDVEAGTMSVDVSVKQLLLMGAVVAGGALLLGALTLALWIGGKWVAQRIGLPVAAI